ncbi:MAG: hypothetical protein RSB23_06030 [Alistipes sp.]
MYKTNNSQAIELNYVTPTLEVIDLRVECGFAASSATGNNENMPTDPEQNPW